MPEMFTYRVTESNYTIEAWYKNRKLAGIHETNDTWNASNSFFFINDLFLYGGM